MHDWEHLLARWVLAVLVFVAVGAMTAPLSALLWRWRRHLGLAQLKGALAAVVLKPVAIALFAAFAFAMPSCAHHEVCYFGWLQQNLGSVGIWLMRMLLLVVAAVLVVFVGRLAVHATGVLRTLQHLQHTSRPPSDALRQALQQVVPTEMHGRFREAPIPADASGVYAGMCFLSEQSVRSLSAMQLRAVVAHEWQHLRARDGWFVLGIGLLVNGIGLGAWGASLRRWSQAAELLADARATQAGVPRTDLAKTLLSQQASAQGLSIGFGADSNLLEARLQSLLMPSVPASRLGWSMWALLAGICLLMLYALWLTGDPSTCTIHCILF